MEADGTVKSQEPAEGTSVEPGTVVKVILE